MKVFLQQAGYVLEPLSNIWSRSGYGGIAYSDGDEAEQRIASIISHASDVTVLSTELRQHCTDWASLYHLSGTRANILRPFKNDFQGDVLEIGAGCGAITRYLGECGANILALEGSRRRAAIARSRTRDLDNVTVLADKFDQFQCDHQFDIVTLIGVLEYANLFTAGENPALSMLERVHSLLKPEGKLIIAIENQLGLKYFAGAPEDHVGQPMYGIEGRYRKDQPQTYGRRELTEILRQAGYANSEFMAAFPDYKLPTSIVTENGFSNEGFDSSALASQSVKRDPQLPPLLVFSPELVWPTLVQNKIALDLANSFLIVAGGFVEQVSHSHILAWHFTTERSKELCKETRFVRTGNASIEVQYYLLAPGSPKQIDERLLMFSVPKKAEYVRGQVLSKHLLNIVTRDGWRTEEVGVFFKKYLHFLGSAAPICDFPLRINSADIQLPGRFFRLYSTKYHCTQ
jgi:2-polyprenyl-3-methyl-5-hydroxy-6-metoxy-1,4-benzoquinol methylase